MKELETSDSQACSPWDVPCLVQFSSSLCSLAEQEAGELFRECVLLCRDLSNQGIAASGVRVVSLEFTYLEDSSILTFTSLCHSGIEGTTLVQAELRLQQSTRTPVLREGGAV